MADAVSTKICCHCKIEKPITEFGKHKASRDGIYPRCKPCHSARGAELRKSEQYQAYKKAYDKQRWADGYGRGRQDWRAANREHLNAGKAAWAKANPEKSKLIKQAYKHRRRAGEAGGPSWAELRRWKEDKPKVCYWCGCKCPKSFHIDHYVPLSKGGKHELGNLVIACGPCNLRKSAKDPLDFAREVGRLL